MTTLLLIALIGFLMYAFPVIPFVLLHIVKMVLYMWKDMFTYIKGRKWKKYANYGIYIFGGLYGGGKSLSISKYCTEIYKKYDNVKFISNIDLHNVPYEKFEYFEQLMDDIKIIVLEKHNFCIHLTRYENRIKHCCLLRKGSACVTRISDSVLCSGLNALKYGE